VWDYPEYEDIINKALEFIISKAPVWSNFEHTANTLFKKPNAKKNNLDKMLKYIGAFIAKNNKSLNHMQVIMNVIVFTFSDQTLYFFKELILLNQDVELFKEINFEKGGAYSGSRVPIIDKEVNFVKQQIDLIKDLPNSLVFVEHLRYLDEKVKWLLETRQRELKADFKEWHD
jgi:hypothetical protein